MPTRTRTRTERRSPSGRWRTPRTNDSASSPTERVLTRRPFEKDMADDCGMTFRNTATTPCRALLAAAHRVLPDPGMHGDPGSNTGVDGSGRPELGDGQGDRGARASFVGEPGPFLPEQEERLAGQLRRLQWHRTGGVVDRQDRVAI